MSANVGDCIDELVGRASRTGVGHLSIGRAGCHDGDDEIIPSMTASLVADLFGRTDAEVARDLRRKRRKPDRQ